MIHNFTSDYWTDMTRKLPKIGKHGLENFLQWDVVQKNMFMKNVTWANYELKYLQSLSNWETRWKPVLVESDIGNPIRHPHYKISSGNQIHMAYHIANFENRSNRLIEDMDFIFEFGGGFGGLCKLIYDLGFKGKYIIYDLLKFNELQKYYLTHFDYIKKIQLLSKKDLYKLRDLKLKTNNLFIATWSLSEAPIYIRNLILNKVDKFNYYLITYQDSFEEINNIVYFNELKKEKVNINWDEWELHHIPKNYYLIGY